MDTERKPTYEELTERVVCQDAEIVSLKRIYSINRVVVRKAMLRIIKSSSVP